MRLAPAFILVTVSMLLCGCASTPPERASSPYTEIEIVSGDWIQIARPHLEEALHVKVVLFDDDGDQTPQPAEVLQEEEADLASGVGSCKVGPFPRLHAGPFEGLWVQATLTAVGGGREVFTARVQDRMR